MEMSRDYTLPLAETYHLNLGFTVEEIMKHVVPIEGLEFSGVSDRKGSLIPDGDHHKSTASTFFHKHLQAALLKARKEAKE
ncbi:hypothetical protein [Pseudomonas sp. LTJR-52]|uniref:hypothetical protein n=1 Tax=Pseudomonas sp. LTJR-52 TaxID=2479392 RepID=UPI0013CE4894|nr:hypothetical protein [Pseudomonas sp. LTJR-52]